MEKYRPGTCFVRFLGGSAVHDWRWVGDWLGIGENGGKQVPGGRVRARKEYRPARVRLAEALEKENKNKFQAHVTRT